MRFNKKQRKQEGRGLKYMWKIKLKSSFNLFILTLVIMLILVIGLRACQESDEKLSAHNLETGVVKIDIQGYHFNVPLRYMYVEAIEKRRHWPTPKKERTKEVYLNIDVLLPDMKPYYPEDDARWIVLGHGDKAHITIVEDKGDEKWFRHMIQMTDENARLRNFYKKEADIYGLIHYSPMGKLGDEYYATDGRRLTIDCVQPQEVPSPSCSVRSNYVSGLGFDYYYSIRYLPHWREIDDKVKALFDQFQQAAQTESTTQTQGQ